MAAAHLLSFEVLVEEIQCRLVGLRAAHDSEHALAGIIVWSWDLLASSVGVYMGVGRTFRNRDARTRRLADLADLAASSADDASHHV